MSLLIIPIPYYDFYITELARKEIVVVWFYSELAIAFMWVRVLLLLRCVLSLSAYNDAYARKLCSFYGFESSARFTIKCYINQQPGYSCLVILLTTNLVFGHMIKITETPYYRQEPDPALYGMMDNYFNTFWLTLITITTVGYGDIYPCTTFGRGVVMLVALWGSFIMSLLVVVMQSIFDMPVQESLALKHINMTRNAARAIVTSLKYFLARRKHHMLRCRRNPLFERKSKFIREMKKVAPNRYFSTYDLIETENKDYDDMYRRAEEQASAQELSTEKYAMVAENSAEKDMILALAIFKDEK